MSANQTRNLLTVLMGLLLLSGCLPLESQFPEEQVTYNGTSTFVGDECDWEDPDACGDGLQCDRIVDAGEVLDEGICMKAQGTHCSGELATSAFDPCGRALTCQPTRRDAAEFRCLPNACIDDSECPDGQRCNNNLCITSSGCTKAN